MRRIPISSGLTPLSFNRITNRLFANCSNPIKATMRNGVRIDVDPNDYHGRILYLFGTNDPKVQAVAEALLRRGDRFLDIGANHSSIGIQVSEVVGNEGQVHLFEPQLVLCERVQAAIDQSALKNIHLHQIGLMDRDGELTLSMPAHHSGMATVISDISNEQWKKQTVQVRDVSAYLTPIIDGNAFGAKIDVEGAEVYIMPWLLRQPTLRFVIFEAAHNQRELWDMIKASGLTLYGLERVVITKQVTRVDVWEQMARYHDLVAVRLRPGESTAKVTTPSRLGQKLV